MGHHFAVLAVECNSRLHSCSHFRSGLLGRPVACKATLVDLRRARSEKLSVIGRGETLSPLVIKVLFAAIFDSLVKNVHNFAELSPL